MMKLLVEDKLGIANEDSVMKAGQLWVSHDRLNKVNTSYFAIRLCTLNLCFTNSFAIT